MDGAHVGHMVYFKMTDPTDEAIAHQLAQCHKYLSGHDGTVYFSVGTLVKDLKREVNDHNFDVALHVVFESRAAHDTYQTSDRHVEFIESNKANWASVRVFDAYVPQ